MKALVYTGPERLDLRDLPDPQPAEGEALIRVLHTGICGSDMHAFAGHDERRPAPLVLGHEAAGEVLEGVHRGRRATINPLVSCGRCGYCRGGRDNLCETRQILSMPPRAGAFAERVAVPERNLVPLPEGFSTARAALVEPLACGWHAIRVARTTLARPLEDTRCLVLGGGAIGLGAALVLAAHGATAIRLAETNASRRARLAVCGDFEVVDPAAHEFGADLVVDAVGIEATRAAACRSVRPGGVIVHIGLGSTAGGLDIRRMTLQEVAFLGTYTYSRTDFAETAQAMFDGRLGALDWPEIRPLCEGARAFDDIRAGRAAAPKIILAP